MLVIKKTPPLLVVFLLCYMYPHFCILTQRESRNLRFDVACGSYKVKEKFRSLLMGKAEGKRQYEDIYQL